MLAAFELITHPKHAMAFDLRGVSEPANAAIAR